jgi:hypothetical protein
MNEKHRLTMRLIALLSVLALGLVGCSKKEAPAADVAQDPAAATAETPAEAPAEAPTEAAAPAPEANTTEAAVEGGQLSQDLNAVPGSLEQANYDTAIENLAAVGYAPKTEAQEQAYQDQLRRTMEYLRQKAETDAAARAAYQKLGRATMGR